MKKDLSHLSQYELIPNHDRAPDGSFRTLFIRFECPVEKRELICLSHNVDGWDCVHVTLASRELKRYPSHEEILFVKDLFFEKDEKVIQMCKERERHTIGLWCNPSVDVNTPWERSF